ncbi:phage tail protein [Roseovarius confluentis]|uniref:phage tail protein n=1 Tax=Roseovarius confluentis TaxID=1852027 RepID=UPI000CDCFDC2|nr:phage tail protein [Roseovarius confluentis]
MAQFSVNTHRLDPYKNFKFRVKWDGRFVAGISKVSALKRSTEVLSLREGGALSRPLRSPGKTAYEPITMERGITHDTAFEDWANQVFSLQGDAAVSLKDMRKDIQVELYNLSGQLVIRYNVFRAWVSDYEALPELDSQGEAMAAIERITLQHEGWERDRDVTEPTET